MARFPQRLARAHVTASYGVVSLLAILVGLWSIRLLWNSVTFWTWAPDEGDALLDLVLLVAFALSFLAWATLHARGWVGSGSAVGFRLVVLGLAACCTAETARALLEVRFFSGPPPDRAQVDPVSAAWLGCLHPTTWMVRMTGLGASAIGILLVSLSTVTEVRRRRRAPAWTRPED